MALERCRDVAHVSAVQLRTQVPEQTVDFFVRLMGLTEVARDGTSSYLRTWDDYERFTICVTAAPASGIGRTWLRAPARTRWPAGSAPSRRPATASAGPTASRGSGRPTCSPTPTATSSGSTGRANGMTRLKGSAPR